MKIKGKKAIAIKLTGEMMITIVLFALLAAIIVYTISRLIGSVL